jgi:DNA-3-methyladenine glycosylase I
VIRCSWASSPYLQPYHDEEWGVPVHDDARLFEFITLEGAQAGLSWETVLRKRDRYREVFAGFAPERVADYGAKQIDALLADPGVIRHRGKLESTVSNARAVLELAAEFGSFDAYLWDFVGGVPIDHRPKSPARVPASTPLAERLSKELRRRGFRFVGPTIVYAFMQAVGIVNDHLAACAFRDPGRVRRTDA